MSQQPQEQEAQRVQAYTLAQIKEAITEELIDAYGGLSKNRDGQEIDQPYFVLGVFHSACERLTTSLKKAAQPNPEDFTVRGAYDELDFDGASYQDASTPSAPDVQPSVNGGEEDEYHKIAFSIAGTRNKPFFIDTFRKLLNQFDKEEISMSRFVEELNVTAVKWASSTPTDPTKELTDEIIEERFYVNEDRMSAGDKERLLKQEGAKWARDFILEQYKQTLNP